MCSGENKPNRHPKMIVGITKYFKKMIKTIKSFIILSLSLGVFYSCSNQDDITTEPQTENLNYKTVKIGNFTSAEIGDLHNKALQSLKDNGKVKGSKEEIILTLQNSNFDSRVSDADISNATNNLYQIKFFQNAQKSTLSKVENVEQLQEDALNFLVSKNEISLGAKDEINNLSTLSIPEMKTKTDELLLSTVYTEKEKQYFAVYTNVYENSNKFWNPNNSTARWQPYAADAVGGVLGLYGGPVWSIVQGALLSAAFD